MSDFDRIEAIRGDRGASHKRLLDLGSEAYRAFLGLERAAFADGELPRKAKELIALGISVVINCESCMEWHVGEALRAGATPSEVLEAVGVGIEMGGGPATVSARFALKALAYHSRPPSQEGSGSGCPRAASP
jgi:AhpD family alkylhydroperoxidase